MKIDIHKLVYMRQYTLSEFVDDYPIIEEFGPEHHMYIEGTRAWCQAVTNAHNRNDKNFPAPRLLGEDENGFQYYRDSSDPSVIFVESPDQKSVGGIVDGTFYVAPEYRGQGIGVNLYLMVFENGFHNFLQTESYSIAGLKNKTKAHKLIVDTLLEAGISLDDCVLNEYNSGYHQKILDRYTSSPALKR